MNYPDFSLADQLLVEAPLRRTFTSTLQLAYPQSGAYNVASQETSCTNRLAPVLPRMRYITGSTEGRSGRD
jgi:hypothetical protein